MPVSYMIERLGHYRRLLVFEHTIFALPFALAGAILATGLSAPQALWPPGDTLMWILLAMIGGRTFAMGLNRLLDAPFDALNPRTANRELPAGRITRVEAWAIALVGLALLGVAAFQLPMLCRLLLPLAVFVLVFYSFCKRFTRWSHLVLGLALGFGAIGAWIAVTGTLDWPPVVLGLAICLWVAGFDMIYACQDAEFDRNHQLLSVPAVMGIPTALGISRLCHAICLFLFAALWWLLPVPLGPGYWLGVASIGVVLAAEHWLVQPERLDRIPMAFFTLNGWVSVVYLAGVILGRLYP